MNNLKPMSTEPKQLTPTERLNLAYSTNGIGAGVPYNFALELATELERVQLEFANAQFHWNQERGEAKCEYSRLFETWQYDCKIWKERIDVTEKERDELKRQVEEWKQICRNRDNTVNQQSKEWVKLKEEIDQLRIENTELRKALERLKEYETSRYDH